MKKLIIIIICSLPILLFAQRVLVKGIARDTSKNNSFVQISVNDTLVRFRNQVVINGGWNTKASDMYEQLTKDSTLVLHVSGLENFRIMADRTDTLYFRRAFYHTSKYAVKDLLKMKPLRIILTPETCVEYNPEICPDTIPHKTYVFIGEKVSVKPVPDIYYCNIIKFDAESIAEYKVVQNIHGNYPGDTARFSVFVHSGPTFFEHKNVMLFVTDYCGRMIQEKYQFFEVYPTVDNRWAFPGDPYLYDQHIKDKTIKPVQIRFKDDLWFDTKTFSFLHPRPVYTDPYYLVEDSKARPLVGTYAEDLLKIKRDGVLNARGITLDKQ
ncbi:hypothetical protein WG906_17310 [Pedobacter sp. P351]|uniref:hypothetical protein n=1 Tax=Pedobacter superstes TaxID=3133441 RepID=UPI00309B5780